jgi:hypothetical protein
MFSHDLFGSSRSLFRISLADHQSCLLVSRHRDDLTLAIGDGVVALRGLEARVVILPRQALRFLSARPIANSLKPLRLEKRG